jgi:hypothetical protein
MSEKPISPLRRRMIEDMTVRNFVEKTHNDYIRHVRTFTTFLGRAPDTAGPEDLRLFQLHQTQTASPISTRSGPFITWWSGLTWHAVHKHNCSRAAAISNFER